MRTLEQLGITRLPWKAKPYQTVTEEWRVVMNGVSTPLASSLDRHTACLIAAAPDCLLSLDEVLAALKNRLPSQPTLEELEIINRAEAAIRRAAGESEVPK